MSCENLMRIATVSKQAFRANSGGRIDRDRPLTFTFNGKRLGGYTGDTLSSALIANGISIVGRSFKYHRPRGIMSAGAEAVSYTHLTLPTNREV